ncbi:hypothetical protein XarjCFBP8253_16550 [Xanthomonas arboricola pv. juglandis]|nr:hypothetical protein C1H21_12875 [Xanthomonas arboricola pv. juglandis]PPT98547.1 hypothetical protein XarjCFBP8253_16550 [Xanthomonas arboricola pv. juglandis]QEX78444.1 hypothetical protein F6Y24_17050 [Xanthomonas arboricola pv. pruni]RST64323.1 hypothetical protein EJK96_21430 [Xanthomonas arboricola pv. pruni]RST80978.1 hypothetical protein EJL05_05220 [Xanthomonas arboricola pv. pruni]
MSCTRLVGRQRGAASGVGTRRESVPGGSVAASMPPHGPAPGSDTTLPPLLLLIGKQCFKHVLMPADFLADVIGKPSICSRRQDGRFEGPPAQHALCISFRNR